MKRQFIYHKIPRSRIATFDVYEVGMKRNHISALLEFDVTESRKKLRELKRKGIKTSFTAWMIKVIGTTINQHAEVAAFLVNKRKMVSFADVNISVMVEKEVNGKKVPIPLVIEKVSEKSLSDITTEIEKAKEEKLKTADIVINRRSKFHERLYYQLPGTLRRAVWRYILANPRFAYKKMGNAVITSLHMMGSINGWFIHKSIHPVSFGIASVVKKPLVIKDEIKAREILNMTVLLDHDVIDGAPMVRFLNKLTQHIEQGVGI